MDEASQVERVLKRDVFGRVEQVVLPSGRYARRVAVGAFPGAGVVARILLARERTALRALEGLAGIAPLGPDDPPRAGVLLRGWIEGCALHETTTLPEDFFDRLTDLVRACHERGVCHNDLHKEQNVLVDEDGYPALVDFQLASVHARRGGSFDGRCREDLRHVEKMRRRYAEQGVKGPRSARPRRSFVAWTWRRLGKPVYHAVTALVGGRDGEPRRPSSGPWPEWTAPVGPRGTAPAGPRAGEEPPGRP